VTVNASVEVHDSSLDGIAAALRTFKKQCIKLNVLQDARRHEAYVKPGDALRRKRKKARTRERKAANKRESYLVRFEDR